MGRLLTTTPNIEVPITDIQVHHRKCTTQNDEMDRHKNCAGIQSVECSSTKEQRYLDCKMTSYIRDLSVGCLGELVESNGELYKSTEKLW